MQREITKERTTEPRHHMKGLKAKEVISLAGIAVTAPILALAILVSARRAAVADYDLLLVLLSLCGAAVSGLNGFGRRTIRTPANQDHKESRTRVALPS
jgi:hypothetical protein